MLESKYQAGFGMIILGQNPLTFMIPIYSTTVLYDIAIVLFGSITKTSMVNIGNNINKIMITDHVYSRSEYHWF